jgi:acetyltransferase-like isoleucine patch superfamily enzyme
MNISKLIPQEILTFFVNLIVKKKYDVVFKKNASGGRYTIFEGKNLLNEKVQLNNCYLGYGTYISGHTKLVRAKMGKFCSIGQNVSNAFGLHPVDFVSTHPCFYSLQKQAGFTYAKKQLFEEHIFTDPEKKYYIEIGNDVWIGNDVKIMDGISIGDGAIVATGSIVTKDVSAYSIVGGIPAKLIRKRFSEPQIKFLLDYKWWNKDLFWIKKNSKHFSSIEELVQNHESK